MDYLHENPVRAGFVSRPEQWLYISAIDYYVINGKGILDLDILQ
jgi:putative transposase